MYHSSEFTKKSYKTGEVANILHVTTATIRNYDKQGKLPIQRTETNRRVIFREDLLAYLDRLGLLEHDELLGKVDVIYARVSSHEQKMKGDLDRQVVYILEQVHTLQNPMILKEVGSGLNDKRPQLQKLIQMVLEGKVRNIYVTYKDRLTRFGFQYLVTLCTYHQVPIVVVKDESKVKSVQEELVEDMMSLIASFSGKLYGLRSGTKKRNIEYEQLTQVFQEEDYLL